MARAALSLGLVAVIGTLLLTGVDALTRERIAQQERRVLLEQLGQIVPDRFDNEPLDDRFTFRAEPWFPKGQQVTAYRARLAGEPVAVVLRFLAVNGYNGNISLLAGINYDGSLRGVRVVSHRETPGLGDGIEAEKSDWVRSFDGKSLGRPPLERWAVRRDGGDFDQFTGATITPRAVVEAVRRALEYHAVNREALFERPADDRKETGG
ncbi:MAG: electron transport complex subunit RsxG [Gammaproteobacteria bacterium]|nr:electron transport complex subunit RsxG [Gammaproteobacteria bacterium]